jgi:hypothetical protein
MLTGTIVIDGYIYGAGNTWTARTAIQNNPIAPDPGAMMLGEYLERGGPGIAACQSAALPTPQEPFVGETATSQVLKKVALVGGIALLFAAAKAAYESTREPEQPR